MSNLQSRSCGAKDFYRRWWDGKHSLEAPFYDKFLTFQWRSANSWFDYGCFIINEKNDLHWKGISSKNNYSSPLYGSNSQTLSAVTFDPVKITLKLGLYGVTKQDYAKFYAWMDPLVIDKLFFDYDKDYYYKVKVSDLKESTKYVLGSQNNKEIYYVETSVTFEIQGESCGWSERLVEWEFTPYSRDGVWIRKGMNRNKSLDNAEWISELRNGIEVYITGIECTQEQDVSVKVFVEEMNNLFSEKVGETKKELFEIKFNKQNEWQQKFIYSSSDGIIFNAEDKQIINLTNSGNNISFLNVSKFLLPSKLEDAYYYCDINTNNIVRDVQLRVLINDKIALFDTVQNCWYVGDGNNLITINQIKIISQLKTPLI